MRIQHGIRIGGNQFQGFQLGGDIFVHIGRPSRFPNLRMIKTYFMSASEHLIPWSDVVDLAAHELCGIVRLPAANTATR